jgi:hypothetical protein
MVKYTYKDLTLPVANALRSALLDCETTEAIHYKIVYENKCAYSPDELTSIIEEIPIKGHGVYMLTKSNKGSITSNDLLPLGNCKVLNEEKLFSIMSREKYKCLVWFDENGKFYFEDLIGNVKEVYDIQNCFNKVPLTAAVLCKEKSKDPYIRNNDTKITSDIELFELEYGDEIKYVFVTESGKPSDHPKWSAVTTASCYSDTDRTVSIEFEVNDDKTPEEVFRKAVEGLINQLQSLSLP